MFEKVIKKAFRISKATATGAVWFWQDYKKFKRLLNKAEIKSRTRVWPFIYDKDVESHTFDKHYVYMDRWAFRNIYKRLPVRHVDVGSSIRFLSMVSVVVPTVFVDIRPISLDFDNFNCQEGSILSLPFPNDSIESLSCLHVAEHIGLGRYGDPLDIEGTQKACRELMRVLKPGGKLYFALPVGKEVTYFNAHRIHSPLTILSYFKGLELVSFSAVNDAGRFVDGAEVNAFTEAVYACGMFEFTKAS